MRVNVIAQTSETNQKNDLRKFFFAYGSLVETRMFQKKNAG